MRYRPDKSWWRSQRCFHEGCVPFGYLIDDPGDLPDSDDAEVADDA